MQRLATPCLANRKSKIVNRLAPYGNPVQNTGGGEPYGYTGEWYESYLDLLFLRARWYAPGDGTFLSRDAVEGVATVPVTLNGYNYANQNPINLTDRSGLSPLFGDPLTACLAMPHCPTLLAGGGTAVAIVAGPTVGVIVAVPSILFATNYYFCGMDGCHVQSTVPAVPAPTAPSLSPPVIGTPSSCYWSADGCKPVSAIPNSDSTPEPEPNPTPTRTIDPGPPVPTCTPEPEERKHISLGLADVRSGDANLVLFTHQLNRELNPFNIYVYYHTQWVRAGLATDGPFSQRFNEATRKAKIVHFNLNGIDDPNDYANRFGNQGRFTSRGWWTAVELFLVRRDLCSKTVFYRKSSTDIFIPSVLDWVDICVAGASSRGIFPN